MALIMNLTEASGRSVYKIQDQVGCLGFKIKRNYNASALTYLTGPAAVHTQLGDAKITINKVLGAGKKSVLIDDRPLTHVLEMDAMATGARMRVTADAAKLLVEATLTLSIMGSMPLDGDTYLEVIITPGANTNEIKVYQHWDFSLNDATRKIEQFPVLANQKKKMTPDDFTTGIVFPVSVLSSLTLKSSAGVEVEFDTAGEVLDFLADRNIFPYLFNGLQALPSAFYMIPRSIITQIEVEYTAEDSIYFLKDKIFV